MFATSNVTKLITVLLAEDYRDIREQFLKILENEDDIKVIGEAENGLQAVAMVKRFLPDLVLMDISMPLLNGFHATRQILKFAPATKVLMLSVHREDVYVDEAINCGAMGYLIKHTAAQIVRSAIREVQKGNTFFSVSINNHLRQRMQKK
jgi:two-component system response regulator NreC